MSSTNFRKLERSSQTPPGWRLATVKEANDNREWIDRHNLLIYWDRVRLLDGWIGGEGYRFTGHEAFRPCLGYMLVVESPTPQISDADDRKVVLYSEVPELSKEGRSAAFLLCCEDWNEEVLYWLLPGLDRAIHKDDQTKAASEVVSAIARKWQDVHADSRGQIWDFSLEVCKESLEALVVDTKKYLGGLIKNENSEQGKIRDEILQLIRESDLTENFEMFQHFGLKVVDRRIWYDVVENMAWQTFYILCSGLYGKVVMHSDPSLRDLIHYAYSYLGKTQKELTAAAKEANADFKRFDEILGFPMFSCKGKPGFLSNCLLWAAQQGDLNLVKRLIESGDVQLSATDDDFYECTALHFAARVENKSDGLKIAEMLLTEDETLATVVTIMKWTPLYVATLNGNDRMCTLLLHHHNASLTAKDDHGRTPLHIAMKWGGAKVVVLLVSAGGEDSNEGSDAQGQSRKDSNEIGFLVDVEDNQGKTPLDCAIKEGYDVSMVAWLLSLSSQPESYFMKLYHPLSVYLRESSRMGYVDLVQKLLDGGADPFEGDDERKTSLHYAAEGADEDAAWQIIEKLLFDKNQGSINWRKASAGDKYGRNILHLVAFLGRQRLCHGLLRANRNLITSLSDSKDPDGQSAIFYAVAGPHDDPYILDMLYLEEAATNLVFVKDFSQTTLLHVAAAKGNLRMVDRLLSLISAEERKKEYVGAPDVLGQTALHKAASGGHEKVVKKLLEEGANLLKERDCDGKTVLHFAAQAEGEQALKIAEMLLENCKSEKQKSLLLFASTVGIGLTLNSSLEEYLKHEKSKIEKRLGAENPLRVAATLGDTDMTLECLTRGANIALIRNKEWIDALPNEDEKKNVQDVLSQIKTIVEQGTDKPALEDNLGRSPFAIGLAALFLNPFVKSPVTVGISGEWGMGKSSVMLQTESNLLKAAAQLAFTKSFQKDGLLEAGESELSIIGKSKRRKIANAIDAERRDGPNIIESIGMSIKRVKIFTAKVSKTILKTSKKQAKEQPDLKKSSKMNNLDKKETTEHLDSKKHSKATYTLIFSRFHKFWSTLRDLWEESAPENLSKFNELLEEKYELKYHQIFKSLAVIDRRDMFEQEEASGSRNQTVSEMPWVEYSLQGTTPSILTVQYNAWHYRDETEAWAGLAVEITKELEATMTVAHKLRTSWIYNWTNHRDIICLKVIFPFILALLVAIFLSIIVWLVFGTAHNKDIMILKYGGIPASMIVFAWGLGKSVMSFVKPISSQVVDYICLPDHSQKLGYQKQVISDINFLKENLSYKFSWKWEVFSFIWCCITWRWKENYVTGTKIPKMPPASGDKLRMIVFVDDLDRCEENVILQVLSAVNLVLAACEINVILSMENSMIQRAILRKYGNINNKDNKSNEELAEKYLRKIVQLPLHLPDPSDAESSDFLKRQLGMWDGFTDPAAETEKYTAHERNKVNLKFQIFTPPPLEKFKQGRKGRKEYFAESVAELERDLAQSANGSGVEEETEIHETTDSEQGIDEEGAGIVKHDTPGIEKADAQQGLGQTEEKETIEKAEGSGVEEENIEIQEISSIEIAVQGSGVDAKIEIEQLIKRDEQQNEIEKAERASPIKILFGYVCALPCLCNKYLRSHKEMDKTTRIEQQIKGDEQVGGDQQQQQGRKGKRSLMDDLSSILSALLIPKYSPGERSAFRFLHTRCTRCRKLPREWKCFMAYHRLAWNIFSLTPDGINRVEGWQVQLIAWIFVCWEWRDLITILIKKWNKLKVLRNWKGEEGPSLREIVEHYIDGRCPADKESDSFQGDEKSATKKEDDTTEKEKTSGNMTIVSSEEDTEGDNDLKKILKEQKEMREALRKVQEDMREVLIKVFKEQEEIREMRDMLEMFKKRIFKEEEDNNGESSLQQGKTVMEEDMEGESPVNQYTAADEREEWNKLRYALRRYNVSMDGIQAFQKFRFYCQPGHLAWPLPEQD